MESHSLDAPDVDLDAVEPPEGDGTIDVDLMLGVAEPPQWNIATLIHDDGRQTPALICSFAGVAIDDDGETPGRFALAFPPESIPELIADLAQLMIGGIKVAPRPEAEASTDEG